MEPLVEAEGEPLLGQFISIHVPQRRYDDVTKTTKEKGIPVTTPDRPISYSKIFPRPNSQFQLQPTQPLQTRSSTSDLQHHPNRRNEIFRVVLLLLEALLECRKSSDDPANHEHQADQGPNDTPALRRTPVTLRKHAGIGRIYFSQNKIIADVPNRIKRRHNAYKKLLPSAKPSIHIASGYSLPRTAKPPHA